MGIPDLDAPGRDRLYVTTSDIEHLAVYLASVQAWIRDANACLVLP